MSEAVIVESRIQKLDGRMSVNLDKGGWARPPFLLTFFIVLDGGTWYCRGPGCPQSVF